MPAWKAGLNFFNLNVGKIQFLRELPPSALYCVDPSRHSLVGHSNRSWKEFQKLYVGREGGDV